MIQPFLEMLPIYIERFVPIEKYYLVSQHYDRTFDHFSDDQKTGILITAYSDLVEAKIHHSAISNDKYGAIINLKLPEHYKKIMSMLEPDSKYAVFWAVVNSAKKLDERLDNRYKANIVRYINKHTNWRIGRDEKLIARFEVTFGELYVNVKRGSQTIRVKFDEIEKS